MCCWNEYNLQIKRIHHFLLEVCVVVRIMIVMALLHPSNDVG